MVLQANIATEENNSEQEKITFQYDRNFQEKIVQALLFDKPWAKQMSEILSEEYFTKQYLKHLTSKIFGYYRQYKKIPSPDYLSQEIKDELANGGDEVLSRNIVGFLKRVISNPDSGDLPGVQAKVFDFCKFQAYKDAMERTALELKDHNYSSMMSHIKKAATAGETPDLGLNYLEDIDARLTENIEGLCPSGIPELDRILNGGLKEKKLGIVMAPTNCGKSQFLVHIAAHAVKLGKKVVYYTFELDENEVGRRFDSHFTQISINDIFKHKEEIKEVCKELKANSHLLIKYYPSHAASVMTIRSHIEKMKMQNGFVPDLICVDYPDIMKPIEKLEARHQDMAQVYRELRDTAGELEIPIWGASQTNREGSVARILSFDHAHGSYEKFQPCDFVIGISSKKIATILKNRMGVMGFHFRIDIDGSTSTVTMYDDLEEGDIKEDSDENSSDNNKGFDRSRNVANDRIKKAIRRAAEKQQLTNSKPEDELTGLELSGIIQP